MDSNHESQADRWTEERLATLNTGAEWQPNTTSAWARLREQRGAAGGHWRMWTWVAVAAATSGVCLMALPAPRAFAQRCTNGCLMLLQGLSRPAPPSAEVKAGGPRKPAPNFALTDADGKTVRLSQFTGKVVLLNFWATWCPPCRVEIPWFVEFQKKYGDRGLVVLGVSVDDDGWKSVRPFLEEMKVNYRMMVGTGPVADSYGGVDALPTTVMIDRDGRIASKHVRLVNKSDYVADIEALLK